MFAGLQFGLRQGLYWRFEPEIHAAIRAAFALLMEKGLLTLATAESVVRFLPPLNVTDEEIDQAVSILDEGLEEWTGK